MFESAPKTETVAMRSSKGQQLLCFVLVSMLQTLSSAAKLEPVKVEPAKEAEDDNIANLTQITPW